MSQTTPPSDDQAVPPQPPQATAQQGPQAVEGPPDQKTWAMLCHLSALSGFVGVPFGNIVGPLVVWLIKKDTMPLVNAEGKKSLNFQITMCIAGVVAALLVIVLIGIPLLIAIGIFDLVCVILASIKANSGQPWKYPLSIKFFK
jgi:hypothetical protein